MKSITKVMLSAALLTQSVVPLLQASELTDPYRDSTLASIAGNTVAYVPILHAVDLSQGWYQGMRDELEPLGVKFVIRDANLNTNTGAQALTTLIAEKPAVIVVQNPDLSAYGRLLMRAESEGIHVISINMRTAAPAGSFVGPDWVSIGKMQAQVAIASCKGASREIAIVQGSPTAAANAFMMTGINDVLSKNPDVKLVANQSADWDTVKARAISQAVIKQHPEVCAIIGSWDGMDLGISAAVKEAGLTGKVQVISSGGGTQAAACDQLKSGAFDAYISYDVPKQVTELGTMIKTLLTSGVKAGQVHANVYTPLTLLTRENSSVPGTCWRL